MLIPMKEIFTITRNMVKVYLHGAFLEINMKEILLKIKEKDMEYILGLMVLFIKETGRKIRCMEKE